jgi:hypothetical protein
MGVGLGQGPIEIARRHLLPSAVEAMEECRRRASTEHRLEPAPIDGARPVDAHTTRPSVHAPSEFVRNLNLLGLVSERKVTRVTSGQLGDAAGFAGCRFSIC